MRLFYRLEGGGSDTVVVLHGGPGLNLEGLRPDLKSLTRHHTLLYLDQRGSGRSEMPDTLRLTAALMVEDLERLRRAFRLDQLTLLGHSWGGGLAVLYAARYPDRVQRMVLVGPVPPRLHPYFDQYSAGQAARHDSAENTRSALLDSLQAVAQDPYQACREAFRLSSYRGSLSIPTPPPGLKSTVTAFVLHLRQSLRQAGGNRPDSAGERDGGSGAGQTEADAAGPNGKGTDAFSKPVPSATRPPLHDLQRARKLTPRPGSRIPGAGLLQARVHD